MASNLPIVCGADINQNQSFSDQDLFRIWPSTLKKVSLPFLPQRFFPPHKPIIAFGRVIIRPLFKVSLMVEITAPVEYSCIWKTSKNQLDNKTKFELVMSEMLLVPLKSSSRKEFKRKTNISINTECWCVCACLSFFYKNSFFSAKPWCSYFSRDLSLKMFLEGS